MRKWIMPLTIVLVLMAAFAYAFEREQMSIDELTSSKIKNTSGTTVLDVGAGTFTGTATGHSTLDLPLTGGTMSGAIRGKRPASFSNMTGAGKQVFGTSTTIVIDNGKVTTGGVTFTMHTSTVGGRLRHILSD